MDNCYCVYIHVNKINNKKYVGLTKQAPHKRWANGKHYENSTYFKHAIEKYGWDNFYHEIIAFNLSKEEASFLEKELIKNYKTTNPEYGYNLDSGGSCPNHSDITKQKISKAITGIKRSQETKEKIRIASTGNKNSLGKRHTEEAKQKNRDAHINKTHVVTDDMKHRICLNQKTRKEVLCVELNRIFVSIGSAARFVNGSQGTISSVLCGTRKTAYGYHWQYK